MDWDRSRRFDDRRGGESYRPTGRSGRSSSRSYIRHARSPPRTRSPRLVADTWVPSNGRAYDRLRSRSPPVYRRRSRSPSFHNRDVGSGSYSRARSPRRFSPRRDVRPRSPPHTWRPRSPYNDSRSRDASWGRNTPNRLRGRSPPSQDFRFSKRDGITSTTGDRYGKPISPSRRSFARENAPRTPIVPRSRSPLHDGRRERYPDILKRRSPSPPRGVSSVQTSATASVANSRRSSPLSNTDKLNTTFSSRSRSPANQSIPHRPFSRPLDRSPSHQERASPAKHRVATTGEARRTSPVEEHATAFAASRQEPDSYGIPKSFPNQHQAEPTQSNMGQMNTPSGVPSQPKAYSLLPGQLPPSGPSHGSKVSTHNRGPNISLLSAPTRPRWASSYRDNSWTGAPTRRAPVPNAPQGPAGSRGNFTPTGPGSEAHRHPVYRQNSVTPASFPRAQRLTNHLAGLYSIIPGGKFFPSDLDPSMEKRLLQLEADQERLFEQITEKQKSKRFCMRDWDKLDRESSISALKSELAEGHLQRITDGEGVCVGTNF